METKNNNGGQPDRARTFTGELFEIEKQFDFRRYGLLRDLPLDGLLHLNIRCDGVVYARNDGLYRIDHDFGLSDLPLDGLLRQQRRDLHMHCGNDRICGDDFDLHDLH